MTALATLLFAATGVLLSVTLMFAVPALTRELFQTRMVDLCEEIDDHIRQGSLPHHAYVREMRDAAYHFAEFPEVARLRNAVIAVRIARQQGSVIEPMRDEFHGVATPAEWFIAEEISAQLSLAVLQQSLRNSVVWLPLAIVVPMARRLSRTIARTLSMAQRLLAMQDSDQGRPRYA